MLVTIERAHFLPTAVAKACSPTPHIIAAQRCGCFDLNPCESASAVLQDEIDLLSESRAPEEYLRLVVHHDACFRSSMNTKFSRAAPARVSSVVSRSTVIPNR